MHKIVHKITPKSDFGIQFQHTKAAGSDKKKKPFRKTETLHMKKTLPYSLETVVTRVGK